MLFCILMSNFEEERSVSTIAIQLLVQVILILINAFFAATEIAVISLNANKLRMLKRVGTNWLPGC